MGTHGTEDWMNMLSCGGHCRREKVLAVHWFWPLFASLTQRRRVQLAFVVDRVALRQISIRVLRFSPVTVIRQTDRTQQLLALRNHFNWQHS